MHAYAAPSDDHSKTVWLVYRENERNGQPIRRSAFLITTDNAHADRIVHAVNAPKNGSFPAVLAAVGARAEQERADWL